jgi:hypothetical protein
VRIEADQRAVQLFLTPAGERLLKVTAGRAVGILQRAVQALDNANLQRLALAMPALVQQLPDGPATGGGAWVRRPGSPSPPQVRLGRRQRTVSAGG